jgi:hypothetical protein
MSSEKRNSAPVIALDIGNVSMKLNFDEMYRRFDLDPGDSESIGRLWRTVSNSLARSLPTRCVGLFGSAISGWRASRSMSSCISMSNSWSLMVGWFCT